MGGKKIRRKRQRSLFSMTTADEFSMLDSGRVSSGFDPMNLSSTFRSRVSVGQQNDDPASREPPSLELLAEMIKEEIRQASGLRQALIRVGIEANDMSHRVSSLSPLDGVGENHNDQQPATNYSPRTGPEKQPGSEAKPRKEVQFIVPDDVRFRWLGIFQEPHDLPPSATESSFADGVDGIGGSDNRAISDTNAPAADQANSGTASAGISSERGTAAAAAPDRYSHAFSLDRHGHGGLGRIDRELTGVSLTSNSSVEAVYGGSRSDATEPSALSNGDNGTSSACSRDPGSPVLKADGQARAVADDTATAFRFQQTLFAAGSNYDDNHATTTTAAGPTSSALAGAPDGSYYKYATISGRSSRRISARLLKEMRELDDNEDRNESSAFAENKAAFPPGFDPGPSADAATSGADRPTSPKFQFGNIGSTFAVASPMMAASNTRASAPKKRYSVSPSFTAPVLPQLDTPAHEGSRTRQSTSQRTISRTTPDSRHGADSTKAPGGTSSATTAAAALAAPTSRPDTTETTSDTETFAKEASNSASSSRGDRDLQPSAEASSLQATSTAAAESTSYFHGTSSASYRRRNSVDGSTGRSASSASSRAACDGPRRRAETEVEDSAHLAAPHSQQPSLFRRVTTSAAHRKSHQQRDEGGGGAQGGILGGTRGFFKTHLRTRTSSHGSQVDKAAAAAHSLAAGKYDNAQEMWEVPGRRSDSEIKSRDPRLRTQPPPQPLPPPPAIAARVQQQLSRSAAKGGDGAKEAVNNVANKSGKGSDRQPQLPHASAVDSHLDVLPFASKKAPSSAPSSTASSGEGVFKTPQDGPVRSTRRSHDDRPRSSAEYNRILRRTTNAPLESFAVHALRQRERKLSAMATGGDEPSTSTRAKPYRGTENASGMPPPPPREFTSGIGRSTAARAADANVSDGDDDSAVQSPPLPKMPPQGAGIDRARRPAEKRATGADTDSIDYHLNRLKSGRKGRRSSFMVTINHMLGRKE
ncbi:hypothetical protein GQ54DRAFT_311482 [Martensiomyces pterosporus]|nr:hypothetical protein GQ54DRAFT_311482 [Martensiomyces pterosporus]